MPKRILVVDDDENILSLERTILEQKGFLVTTAGGGEEALKLLREQSFDLVLLDVMMPKMSGFDVLDALKGDPSVRDIPVIMLTNLETAADVRRAADAGAHSYLVKSNMNLDELAARIADALSLRARL